MAPTIATHMGKDALARYYASLAAQFQPGDFFYTLGLLFEYQDEWLRALLQDFHRKLAEKGIDDRAIFTPDTESVIRRVFKDNASLRLKFQAFDAPLGIALTKGRVLQMGMRPEPFVLETDSPLLCDYYHYFFLQQWNRGEALALAQEAATRFGLSFNLESLRSADISLEHSPAMAVAGRIEQLEDTWGKDGQQIKLWSVPKTTAQFLRYFTIATGSRNILEIGTSGGYSTLHLALGAARTGGTVTTVELLDRKADLAERHFKESALVNIRSLRGDAKELLRSADMRDLNLVFLDADQKHYGRYLELILPRLKVGGFLLADNASDYGYLMPDFLGKALGTIPLDAEGDPQIRSHLLPADNGLMIIQRIS